MLTYETQTSGQSGAVKVFLDGKHIGDIKQEVAPPEHDLHYLWRYWPKGQGKKWAGQAFPSIRKVRESLEGYL